jgi:hypothetical protein
MCFFSVASFVREVPAGRRAVGEGLCFFWSYACFIVWFVILF